MVKKKTTLMFEQSLYDQVRMRAAQERKSVSDVVAEAAREYLAARTRPEGVVELPVVEGVKLKLPAHINPNSMSQVLDYLDDLDQASGHGFSQI